MNRHLIPRIHLIKLIDVANPVIGEHQAPRLDAEIACFRIPYDCGGETCGGGCFAGGIDGGGRCGRI